MKFREFSIWNPKDKGLIYNQIWHKNSLISQLNDAKNQGLRFFCDLNPGEIFYIGEKEYVALFGSYLYSIVLHHDEISDQNLSNSTSEHLEKDDQNIIVDVLNSKEDDFLSRLKIQELVKIVFETIYSSLQIYSMESDILDRAEFIYSDQTDLATNLVINLLFDYHGNFNGFSSNFCSLFFNKKDSTIIESFKSIFDTANQLIENNQNIKSKITSDDNEHLRMLGTDHAYGENTGGILNTGVHSWYRSNPTNLKKNTIKSLLLLDPISVCLLTVTEKISGLGFLSKNKIEYYDNTVLVYIDGYADSTILTDYILEIQIPDDKSHNKQKIKSNKLYFLDNCARVKSFPSDNLIIKFSPPIGDFNIAKLKTYSDFRLPIDINLQVDINKSNKNSTDYLITLKIRYNHNEIGFFKNQYKSDTGCEMNNFKIEIIMLSPPKHIVSEEGSISLADNTIFWNIPHLYANTEFQQISYICEDAWPRLFLNFDVLKYSLSGITVSSLNLDKQIIKNGNHMKFEKGLKQILVCRNFELRLSSTDSRRIY